MVGLLRLGWTKIASSASKGMPFRRRFLCSLWGNLVQEPKVGVLESMYRRCCLELVNANLVDSGWLLSRHKPASHGAGLTVLELALSHWPSCDVLPHLAFQDQLTQLSHSTSQRNGIGIILGKVQFAWLFQYLLCHEILLWRHIKRIKWTVVADISVLLPSLLLIAVYLVPLLKLV